MRFSLIFTLLAFFGLNVLNSQSNTDPVLFTIDGQPVLASEFSYIYAKNNREDADFSQNSLEEYLDLYTKFKLKVREAYAMGLDTLPQLQSELAGYRKQLAESYLTDKEITDRLVQEAYTRMQEDVHVAHILFKTNPNVATDTLAAYTKAQAAYKRLKAGETWDVVTKATSEDGGSKDTGGDIGFVTALLPNGFYAFENAAYDTPVGQYSAPVRTTLGYHIVKVIGKRPARGEMDVAHILARVKTDGSDDKIKKAKIDSIYTQIKGGAKFDELARKLSEDKTTAERGGAIGPIAINQYEKAFEEAAFGLANDGDYSAPVRTRLGWHIIKRTRKRPALTFDQAKRKIETQISKDERITSARQAMVTRIKKEAGFTIDSTIYKQFVANAGPDLQTYKWQVPNVPSATIMTLGADKYTNQDFGNYIRNNARTRMSLPKGTPNKDILDKVFNEFVNEKALFFEEKNLSVKYPEFKSLMREYEEGILLFEATKINVWDKASKDSTGLEAYHAAHLNDYMWDERVEVATVTMDSASMDKLATVKKWAAKKPIATVEEMAAKKKIGLQVSRKIYQKDDTLPEGLTRTPEQKQISPKARALWPSTRSSLRHQRPWTKQEAISLLIIRISLKRTG